eukprot:TRINITY_DN74361_c0_g1_i1.p2 TRINITY_DN74361_c0_g1~~TRINITY_DN74361_c0_g1_i1.p2  ORF type:complete len:148 (+),score=34.74 TRINITY_DN74361_c0_g1_i1:62-505(+)
MACCVMRPSVVRRAALFRTSSPVFDKLYTKTHEWFEAEADGKYRVGISLYAQDQLGKIVFVQPPTDGVHIKKGELLLEVESVKVNGEIYAPVSGNVVEFNQELNENPGLINDEAEGSGWLVKMDGVESPDQSQFLDAKSYKEYVDAL